MWGAGRRSQPGVSQQQVGWRDRSQNSSATVMQCSVACIQAGHVRTQAWQQWQRKLLCAMLCCPLQAFKGIWRMQPAGADPSSTTLQYSLFVRPHPWLPVKLIEDRISSEVVNNLNAVRRHTERVHKQRQQQGAIVFSSVDSNATERSSSTLSSSSTSTTLGVESVSSEE